MITPKTSIQFTDNTTSVTITVDGVQIAVYAKNKFSIYPNPNAGADEIDLKYVEQEMSDEIFFRFNYTQILPLQPSKAAAVSYLAGIFFLASGGDPSGVTAGNYPITGSIPTFSVDSLGRLTLAGSSTNGSNIINIQMTGDVTGTSNANKVVAIQNKPVANTAPLNGDILFYNGTNWLPYNNESREVIGGLSYPAIWYPNEGIGSTYETTSAGFIIPITSIGFYRVMKKGTFKDFAWTNSFPPPPNSQIDAQIWICPNGDPNSTFFTGTTLTMLAGSFISTNNIDTIDVNPDDMIFLYNSTPLIGYTGGQITITGQFTQKF